MDNRHNGDTLIGMNPLLVVVRSLNVLPFNEVVKLLADVSSFFGCEPRGTSISSECGERNKTRGQCITLSIMCLLLLDLQDVISLLNRDNHRSLHLSD